MSACKILLATGLLLASAAQLVGREWTSAAGQHHIKADFVSFDGRTVRLRMSDGRVVDVLLEKLSNADQRFARAAESLARPAAETKKPPRQPSRDASAPDVKNIGPFSAKGTVVQPGRGALSRALKKVRKWNALLLRPGKYVEDEILVIPHGVAILGAKNGGSKLQVRGVLLGGQNLLRHLEFARDAQLKDQNGILVHGVPARIERCVFLGLQMAVVLKEAPLVDIVQCDFLLCNIGVWINDGASPTIWGCRFQACSTGIGSLEGTPFIADNLFFSCHKALNVNVHEPTIVRNNVFSHSGLWSTSMGTDKNARLVAYSNVFYEAKPLQISGKAWFSHNLFYPRPRKRFSEKSTPIDEREVFFFDPGYAETKTGDLRARFPDRLLGRGFRLGNKMLRRFDSAPNTIGLTNPKAITGAAGSSKPVPPWRWSEPFLVNGFREEEILVKRLHKDDKVVEIQRDLSEETETWVLESDKKIRFDIHRFFASRILPEPKKK